MPKTARIEVRTNPEHEALLKQATALSNQTLTSCAIAAVVSGSPAGLDAVSDELCAAVTDALVDLAAVVHGQRLRCAPDATDRITALVAQAGSILRAHHYDQEDAAVMGMVAAVTARARGARSLPVAASGADARRTMVTAWAVARAAADPASL